MSLSLWNRLDPFFSFDPFTNTMTTTGTREGRERRREGELELWRPAIDIKETDKEYVIHAELPGVKKEDISIDLDKNLLTLSGERKQEKKEENERYYRVERSYGKFSRTITVPEGITPDQIRARFENGVLEVDIPKLEGKKEEPKKINVS
jgi:HSP20 family protein